MKSTLQTRLATNLKQIRKEKKLTQFELAEKANISEAMVKSIELTHSWPSEKTLTQLANALSVDIINFFIPESASNFIDSSLYSELKEVVTENFNTYLQNVFSEIKV